MSGSSQEPTILVIGAAGGVGSRVVRLLLKQSRRVRAVVRSKSRLIEALSNLGIDVDMNLSKDLLEIVEMDMTQLTPEVFANVVGVANCAGTTTQPNVGPDGTPLSPPVRLGSPPRYVEYSGANRVALLAARHFDEATEFGPALFNATDREEVRRTWGALDDVVMGGVSSSRVISRDIGLVFNGTVSTDNNGGFASVRSRNADVAFDLGEYDGVVARMKGDGQSYKLIARTDDDWDGVAFCKTVATTAGEWIDVRVPFEEFQPVRRGRTVKEAGSVDKTRIIAWQLMLSKFEYDGELNPTFRPGNFELVVESIAGFRTKRTETTGAKGGDGAKLVHVSAAAVTRPLREEVKGTELEVDIVKLNKTVGGLLNWKLAGEDRVRVSGVSYTVVRPCGLRNDEGVGVGKLTMGQGDSMRGMTSREDVAEFVVEAFDRAEVVGKTMEIVSMGDGYAVDGATLQEKLGGLKTDDEEVRAFAEFPYVPKDFN